MRHIHERQDLVGTKPAVPTVYEWAGGAEAIERLVKTFYGLTLQDDLLRPFFEHMPPTHIHNVALWMGEVFGGPKAYSAIRGEETAHPYMIKQHTDLHITEEQRARWIQLMESAADIEKLPDDPEFRSAFIAYIEWGTRMAKMFSNGAPGPEKKPMPQWGWGEAPPYIADEAN
jgi:hemoglobin